MTRKYDTPSSLVSELCTQGQWSGSEFYQALCASPPSRNDWLLAFLTFHLRQLIKLHHETAIGAALCREQGQAGVSPCSSSAATLRRLCMQAPACHCACKPSLSRLPALHPAWAPVIAALPRLARARPAFFLYFFRRTLSYIWRPFNRPSAVGKGERRPLAGSRKVCTVQTARYRLLAAPVVVCFTVRLHRRLLSPESDPIRCGRRFWLLFVEAVEREREADSSLDEPGVSDASNAPSG